MSLYAMQKFLFALNRDAEVQRRYAEGDGTRAALLAAYDLDDEEREAIDKGDIGKLYVLGCNGQLLMHFAPLLGICLLYTSPSPRDGLLSRMPSSA